MLNITPIAQAVGSVTVSRSRKVNLGNYESEDVFVSVTVPVSADYLSTYNEAMAFVEQQLDAEVEQLTGKSVNRVTKARAASEPKKAETKVETKEEVEAEEQTETKVVATKSAPKVKQIDVRAALKDIKDNIGNEEYKGVLAKFGVKSFGALKEENYAAVIEACEEVKQKVAQADEVEEEDESLEEEHITQEDDLDSDDDDLETAQPAITLEEFKSALREYNATNGKGAHKEILAKFEYASINEIPEGRYAEIVAEMV